jgi:hypothetical protein
MKYLIRLILVACCAIFTGCAGKYAQYYVRISEAESTGKWPKPIMADSFPSPDTVSKYGLHVLGYSAFYEYNISSPAINDALTNGKHVGADFVVILRPKMLGSQTALVDVPHLIMSTSSTRSSTDLNIHGNVRDANGFQFGSYNGYGTANTNSTTTTNTVYTTQEYRTFDRYMHGALFLKVNDTNYNKRLDSIESAKNEVKSISKSDVKSDNKPHSRYLGAH